MTFVCLESHLGFKTLSLTEIGTKGGSNAHGRTHMTQLVRTVDCSVPPTRTTLEACASLGISLRRTTRLRRDSAYRVAAAEVHATLKRGQIALLTGPSGCGKTGMLLALANRLRRSTPEAVVVARSSDESAMSVVEHVAASCAGGWPRAMGLLARAGLADGLLLARTARELSDGQRSRLMLALAMGEAEQRLERAGSRRVTVLVDEFASNLDRVTARGVCRTLRRWVNRNRRVRVVVATSHADVRAWLSPETVWHG